MPEVTVLMPVHNAAPFLREAVDSVLCQTFDDFELLVIDDGSTDATGELLSGYADRRMRVVRLESNAGLVAALNIGISQARAALIARMDGDDICEPQRLELQVAFMWQHPDVVLLGSGFVRVDTAGRPLQRVVYPKENEVLQEKLLEGSVFCHPSTMMRADVVRQLGGYRDLGGGPAEDYDLWLRISERGQIANLSDVLLRYRVHAGQTSVRKLLSQRQAAYFCKILAMQRRAGQTENLEAAQSMTLLFPQELVQALRADYLRWAETLAAGGHRGLALQMVMGAHRLNRRHPAPWLQFCRIILAELSGWAGPPGRDYDARRLAPRSGAQSKGN
jgi:glycosyltransferase involved in cell wall biosynthesis